MIGRLEKKINRHEWIWLVTVSVLIVMVLTLPYIVGVQTSTDDMQFGGLLWALGDMNSYIAKMRYGAADGWLFRIPYTTEIHPRTIIYPHYIGLGKLGAFVSGQGERVSPATLILSYHIARVVLGLLLLVVMYRFVAEYFLAIPKRRLAWILTVAVSGLGWFPLVLSALGVVGEVENAIALYVPEAFTTLLLYGMPHLSLSRLLMLTGWLLLFRAQETHNGYKAFTAGMMWFGMGIVVPFYTALIGLHVVIWLGAQWISSRQFPRNTFYLCLLAGIGPLLVFVYNLYVFSSDPVYAAWAAQNKLPSPPLIQFLLAFGLLVVLAVPGIIQTVRTPVSPRRLVLLTWPLVAAVMVYSPISVQRRLLEGVIVPLSILATIGIWQIAGTKPEEDRLRFKWRVRQLLVGLLIALMLPAQVLLIGGGTLRALNQDWPVFHPSDELAALEWLRDNASPGDVVLASHAQSNVIPAYAAVVTYVGLGPETINEDQKILETEAFFNGRMEDHQRIQLLDVSRTRFVWVGPYEQPQLCTTLCLEPETLHLLEVFTRGDISIYEVGGRP